MQSKVKLVPNSSKVFSLALVLTSWFFFSAADASVGIFDFAVSSSVAKQQTFEGIIEGVATFPEGTVNLTWYIADEGIALEMETQDDSGVSRNRYVVEKDALQLVIITDKGKRYEIPQEEINPTKEFGNQLIRNEEMKRFSKMQGYDTYTLEASTERVDGEMEISSEIDVNWSKYAPFFSTDLGIQALAQSQKSGFVLASRVTDKSDGLHYAYMTSRVVEKELSLTDLLGE